MKKLFALADAYLKESDWKDLALIKLCLCAMGVLIGMTLPRKHRRVVVPAALAVFAATYIPLMAKVVRILLVPEEDRNGV